MKTTTATALAVGLARRGQRVLFVDCDAQANAFWTLSGGQGSEPPGLAEVLLRDTLAEDAIRATTTPRLDLLPADGSLSAANVALVQELGRDARLRSALNRAGDHWDFVILDTAPTITTVLANALVYAAEVIVPVDAGVYALLGLVQLQDTIAEVRDAYGNDDLHLSGLLLTRTARNNVCRDVEAELRGRFGDLVYRATIPLSAKVEEAHTRGRTVLEHSPRSAASVAYDQFIMEVLEHGQHGARAEERGRGNAGLSPGTETTDTSNTNAA